MKIAVPYETGMIFQHFGRSQQFKIYAVDSGSVTATDVIDTSGSGHGALAGFLKSQGVNALICGGIGAGAQQALAEAKIQLYGGVTGSADQAVEDLLSHKLVFHEDVQCGCHGGHDH